MNKVAKPFSFLMICRALIIYVRPRYLPEVNVVCDEGDFIEKSKFINNLFNRFFIFGAHIWSVLVNKESMGGSNMDIHKCGCGKEPTFLIGEEKDDTKGIPAYIICECGMRTMVKWGETKEEALEAVVEVWNGSMNNDVHALSNNKKNMNMRNPEDNYPIKFIPIISNDLSFTDDNLEDINKNKTLFLAKEVKYTKKAGELLSDLEESPAIYLDRHEMGDWGLISEFECKKNEKSLRENAQIVSIYTVSSGKRVMLITDLTESITTFLMPEEYNGNSQSPVIEEDSVRTWYKIHFE